MVTKRVVEGKEPAGYFSRAEKWKFDQVFSDEENKSTSTDGSADSGGGASGGKSEEVHGATAEAEREAEERERERIERIDKRRRKVAAA